MVFLLEPWRGRGWSNQAHFRQLLMRPPFCLRSWTSYITAGNQETNGNRQSTNHHLLKHSITLPHFISQSSHRANLDAVGEEIHR